MYLNNTMRLIRIFIFSVGILLLIVAMAKFISIFGKAYILQRDDPILSISFRKVFMIVGTVEFVIALVCLFSRRVELQAFIIAWLSTSFVIYRLGLLWVGYYKPCSCLGNLTDALGIPPQVVNTTMKIILAYLLVGSYATLFWLWKLKTNLSPRGISKRTTLGNDQIF